MTTSIRREELVERLAGDTPIALVEALGPGYYADAHLPGALNMPPDQVDRLAPHLLPDPTSEVIVYSSGTCQHAVMVAQQLADLGYQHVRIYAGGKEDWVEHGLPVERQG